MKNNKGFTIIELMIATAVFSVVLLIVTAGIIVFTHQYFNGITRNSTQNVSRAIANRLAQDIQTAPVGSLTLSDGTPSHPDGYFCIGTNVYRFTLGTEVSASAHGLVVLTGACGLAAQSPNALASLSAANASELLGQSMRLGALDVHSLSANLYQVTVKVIYGDNDLLTPAISGSTDWNTETCQGGSGSEYCAISQLITEVGKRTPST